MKKITLYSFIIFSIIAVNVKAQSDSLLYHKFMLSFSAGIAVPFAKFAEFEINPDEYTTIITGVPKTGKNLDLNVAYYFKKNFGIYCRFNTTINNTNPVDSADLFYDPYLYHGQGGNSRLISYSYNTNNWQSDELLIGILYTISKSNNIFNFKLAAGVQKAVSPKAQLDETVSVWRLDEPNYYPDNYIYNSTLIQPQMISYNFVADIGLDWAYRIKKNFGMIFKLDCVVSKASFTGMSEKKFNVEDGVNHIHTSALINANYSKNIDLITLGVGIYYCL